MSIKVKSGGAYADITGVFHKRAGAYEAVQGVFVKAGGVYGRVDSIQISGVSAEGSGTTITVTWTSSPAAYSRVQFGTSSGVYSGEVDNVGALVTSHEVVLDASDGIGSGTYYYRVGCSTNGTTWNYSDEYSVSTEPPSIAKFDIAANALANSWTNGQSVAAVSSSNSADQLTQGTLARQPTYNSADNSLRFASALMSIGKDNFSSYAEVFAVVTDTGVNNFNGIVTLDDAANAGPTVQTSNVGGNWYLNAGAVAGRLSGQKQIILVRAETNTVYIRTVGSGSNDVESNRAASGTPTSFIKLNFSDRSAQNPTANLILHDVVVCPALTPTERNSWFTILKTKHGI